jgi:hypothetical protein
MYRLLVNIPRFKSDDPFFGSDVLHADSLIDRDIESGRFGGIDCLRLRDLNMSVLPENNIGLLKRAVL